MTPNTRLHTPHRTPHPARRDPAAPPQPVSHQVIKGERVVFYERSEVLIEWRSVHLSSELVSREWFVSREAEGRVGARHLAAA